MSGPALYALPPDSVAVGGARYALNTGHRAALRALAALEDGRLAVFEQQGLLLRLLYKLSLIHILEAAWDPARRTVYLFGEETAFRLCNEDAAALLKARGCLLYTSKGLLVLTTITATPTALARLWT